MAFDLIALFTSPQAVELLYVAIIFILTYVGVRAYRVVDRKSVV